MTSNDAFKASTILRGDFNIFLHKDNILDTVIKLSPIDNHYMLKVQVPLSKPHRNVSMNSENI